MFSNFLFFLFVKPFSMCPCLCPFTCPCPWPCQFYISFFMFQYIHVHFMFMFSSVSFPPSPPPRLSFAFILRFQPSIYLLCLSHAFSHLFFSLSIFDPLFLPSVSFPLSLSLSSFTCVSPRYRFLSLSLSSASLRNSVFQLIDLSRKG
jgi:hypothetical protein